MIEMRWSEVKFGDYKENMEQLSKHVNVAGRPHVLQFRDVVERYEDGRAKIATDWQDVEVAKEQP